MRSQPIVYVVWRNVSSVLLICLQTKLQLWENVRVGGASPTCSSCAINNFSQCVAWKAMEVFRHRIYAFAQKRFGLLRRIQSINLCCSDFGRNVCCFAFGRRVCCFVQSYSHCFVPLWTHCFVQLWLYCLVWLQEYYFVWLRLHYFVWHSLHYFSRS